jgi:hypothetical protein
VTQASKVAVWVPPLLGEAAHNAARWPGECPESVRRGLAAVAGIYRPFPWPSEAGPIQLPAGYLDDYEEAGKRWYSKIFHTSEVLQASNFG